MLAHSVVAGFTRAAGVIRCLPTTPLIDVAILTDAGEFFWFCCAPIAHLTASASRLVRYHSEMVPKSQRQMMRELCSRYAGDAEQIIRAYAEAEKRGDVVRRRDAHVLTAEQYAKALWSDGVRKGWLGQ